MKPLIIYHANCADGFGAAFAAWLKLGDEAEYLPMSYDQDPTESIPEIKGREVYVLDFSFERVAMDWLFNNAKRVVWLDHHKTAFEMYSGDYLFDEITCVIGQKANDHVRLHNNKSGAMLAWEHFHPGTEVPMLIKHIDDYDRWQFKLEGTKALWSYAPWGFRLWEDLTGVGDKHSTRFEQHSTACLISEGEAILRAHEQNVQSMIEMGKKYKTRDGRSARVICIDREGACPVIALIQTDFHEAIIPYRADGTHSHHKVSDLIEVGPYADFKTDEPVMVATAASPNEWWCRYFAGVNKEGLPRTWYAGRTSWTARGDMNTWALCRRPTAEELK